MRINNAFHTYELIFAFLINYSKISATWGKGKYFSDYEYPEIQLLFSPKGKNGEQVNKAGNNKIVQSKAGFSSVLDSDSGSYLEVADRQKLPKGQNSKPWMRRPYTDGVIFDEPINNEEKVINAEKFKIPVERKISSSKPFSEIPRGEVEERQSWPKEAKPRNRLSSLVNTQKEFDTDPDTALQPRKLKYRKRVKIQSRNRLSPFRGGAISKFKNQDVKAWRDSDAYLPRYNAMDTGNDVEPKQRKNVVLPNINEKIYSDPRILPDYEGNIQEYDEFSGVLNKNEPISINKQPSTTLAAGQTKEEVISSAKQQHEVPGMVNDKIIIKNIKSTVTNEPIKVESTHAKVTKVYQNTVNNEMTLVNRGQSLVTEKSSLVSEMPLAAASISSIQEMKSDLQPNISNRSNEELKKENNMLVRQPNRVVQENHPLLAKPPVKIAGTLMDKHSEDDNEINLEETGTKVVKVPQINSIIQSSTVLSPTGMSIGLKNNVRNNAGEQETPDSVHLVNKYVPSPKQKRNVNENKTAITQDVILENSASVAGSYPPKNIVDSKIPEKESNLELMDAPIDFDNDETFESRKSKFLKPQYYSLSKSNSALGIVNNLITKLKPGTFLKKKKNREEKYNDSFNKRNAPLAYDLMYEPGYDYYKKKNGKKGDPIRSYYDYENDYDLDYDKDKDYTRVNHLNNTALADEKELYEYGGKSYSNNFSRNKNKLKRKKYRKVEETYSDIFAHPLSLDDPELQIVRDDDDEIVKRRMHHKNFATRHHKEKSAAKEFPLYKERSAEVEFWPRNHLKKKKAEQELYPRHDKVQVAMKQAIAENEVSDKKIH
ncbi:uncharacterized protein [Halyomorpha halys]|uniref:uncharacterized protein n=1 Tax=Halyomorpha halys TaxID=286706 RepID=UPI0006D4D90B|nr:uncharacterized protein LOC106685899 [Halyomorpha halys]